MSREPVDTDAVAREMSRMVLDNAADAIETSKRQLKEQTQTSLGTLVDPYWRGVIEGMEVSIGALRAAAEVGARDPREPTEAPPDPRSI